MPFYFSLLPGRSSIAIRRTVLQVSHCFLQVRYVFIMPHEVCLMIGKLLLVGLIQRPDQSDDLVVDSLADLSLQSGAKGIKNIVYVACSGCAGRQRVGALK